MPGLKEHLLTRLQRISEEVNEEQRAVQELEAELTRTDHELMRAEQEIERTRVEMDVARDEIHQLELSLHPHSAGNVQRATAPWTRLFAPVLIGAGVLGTALYWTQGGSAWI
jgi:molybdenum-dependent DNA-binding transcriptional regulator ModE